MDNPGEKTVVVTAEIPDSMLATLTELASKRGVSANTVLQQAIATEKLLADARDAGSKVLLEKRDRSFTQLHFNDVPK